MILSAATLRKLKPVTPFYERGIIRGRSFGLSVASYDVRIAQSFYLLPGEFKLASTLEKFNMPNHVAATVADKSSYARQGLSVFNTFIDPGFRGFLTLELKNLGDASLRFEKGDPIAQVLFYFTDDPTEGYTGKFQNQSAGPQKARYEIPLTQGQFAIVSAEDFDHISKYKWHAWKAPKHRTYYAAHSWKKNGKAGTIYMHQMVLPGQGEIDHRNHNGLDNRRENLRLALGRNHQNTRLSKRNKTGYKGVSFTDNKYQAFIRTGKKSKYLGSFSSKEDAAKEYDKAALKYFGEFASLNFPKENH